MFVLQVNKPVGLDVDSQAYYDLVINGGASFTGYATEPVFRLLIDFCKQVSDYPFQLLLAIYFFTSVLIKIYCIKRDSDFFLLSFISYLSFYAILHDIVQIRVGLSVALFLLALKDIANKNITSFLVKIILASFCHYSALIALPLYFLNRERFNRLYWVMLLLSSICFGIFSIYGMGFFSELITKIPGAVGAKLQRYLVLMNEGVHSEIHLFNYYNGCLTLLSLFFAFFAPKFNNYLKIINIKIFILSQCSFYLLSFLPVLAFRVSEFLGVTIIYVITYNIYLFKNKTLAYFITLIFLFGVLVFNLFVKSYIDWGVVKYYEF